MVIRTETHQQVDPLKGVVISTHMGKRGRYYVVRLTEESEGRASVQKVTFSPKAWTSTIPPAIRQLVKLFELAKFERGLRAQLVKPDRGLKE